MTFLITVAAVMVGCFLYDLTMNTVMRLRARRALKGLGDLQAEMEARLAELTKDHG